jgi:hypothetical protein
MRGFFLLLLLSNVAIVAWLYYEHREQKDTIDIYRNILIVNNGLTLLSELPEEQRPALLDSEEGSDAVEEEQDRTNGAGTGESETAVIESDERPLTEIQAGNDVSVCFLVRELENKSDLRALLGRLEKSGAKILDQGKEQITQNNYWVFLPSYPNRRKANEAAAILAKRRIKDFFVVRSGEHENAISLGVFSTKERADSRYQEIVGLKARLRKPKIETLELPAPHFQVSYQIKGPGKVTGISSYLKRMKLPSAKEIRCK